MLIDFTLKVTPEIEKEAKANLKKASAGHIGTHFDVMNKDFPDGQDPLAEWWQKYKIMR